MMAAASGRAMASSSRATSSQSARHGGVVCRGRGWGARPCAGQRGVWPVAMAVLWAALSTAPQTRAGLFAAMAVADMPAKTQTTPLLSLVQKGGLLTSGRHNAFLGKRNANYGLGAVDFTHGGQAFSDAESPGLQRDVAVEEVATHPPIEDGVRPHKRPFSSQPGSPVSPVSRIMRVGDRETVQTTGRSRPGAPCANVTCDTLSPKSSEQGRLLFSQIDDRIIMADGPRAAVLLWREADISTLR